jgi:hypothetical protein
MTAAGAEVRRAVPELTALAAAVRPDWDRANVGAVIANAAAVGMTWPQVLVALPRLMADPHARPSELVPDHRDPMAPHPADPPNDAFLAAKAAITRKDPDHA